MGDRDAPKDVIQIEDNIETYTRGWNLTTLGLEGGIHKPKGATH